MSLSRWPLVLLLAAVLPAQAAAESPAPFDLYLVRHAEKTAEPDDPGLTPAGRHRAQRLAAGLSRAPIRAVWSSDYLRSRATALPLAEMLGLDISLYDPRQLEAQAARLLDRAQTAVVIGHSNTTPRLAALLCACEVAAMPHTEYDRMFVVTIDGATAQVFDAHQDEIMARLAVNPGAGEPDASR